MVFMELQERSVIRLLLFIWIVIIGACTNSDEGMAPECDCTSICYNVDSIETQFKNEYLLLSDELVQGVIYSLNSKGDTISILCYNKGLKCGEAIEWYDNGKKKSARHYLLGRKHGSQKRWWPNGQMALSYIAEHDLIEGEFREWHTNGILFKQLFYIGGMEQGLQRQWSENGNLMVNYEAKNGRNYGNTGIKSCATVWTDE